MNLIHPCTQFKVFWKQTLQYAQSSLVIFFNQIIRLVFTADMIE